MTVSEKNTKEPVLNPDRRVDPRVLRTRNLLEQAFAELLEEKGFQEMTIQDITERATVNRATFYAHFEDKYDLFDHFIRRHFNEALAEKAPLSAECTVERLQRIIVTVMEFYAPVHHHCTPTGKQQMAPMFESAVQEELKRYLLKWLGMSAMALIPLGVNPVIAANLWSWAIFGAAVQWAQENQKVPAADLARQVTAVLIAFCPEK
jgi:AcrR family transcriptional regulator